MSLLQAMRQMDADEIANFSTEISPAELRQLNIQQADFELAREKHAHAQTKAELVRHAADAAAAKTELARRDACEQAAARVRETQDAMTAAQQMLQHLTADIRRTHNLTEKHAIDGETGAVMAPGE